MFVFIRYGGISLFELMVALAILAVLSAVSLPALQDWVDSNRSKTTRQQLQSFLGHARNDALQRANVVTLCSLADSGSCADTLEFPISQFVDADADARLDSDEELLKTLDIELPDHVELRWNRGDYMRFWPSGGTGALTGSLSYCESLGGKNDFRIVIARTGRVRADFDETRCP